MLLISFLGYVTPDGGFEWGSGGFTSSSPEVQLHTVEHDPDWRVFSPKDGRLNVMNVNIQEIPGSRIDDFNEIIAIPRFCVNDRNRPPRLRVCQSN